MTAASSSKEEGEERKLPWEGSWRRRNVGGPKGTWEERRGGGGERGAVSQVLFFEVLGLIYRIKTLPSR